MAIDCGSIHFTRWQMAKIAYGATRDQLALIGDWFPGVNFCNRVDAVHAAVRAFIRGPVDLVSRTTTHRSTVAGGIAQAYANLQLQEYIDGRDVEGED